MDDYLNEDITRARNAAQTAASSAGTFAAKGGTVADELKQKALQSYKDNEDIISRLDTSTADYLSSPAVAREKYQDIFNPFARESLVSQYSNNQLIPMLSYGGMYGQRMGRIDDLIGAGTRAYEAETARRMAEANAAQQNYENLLNEYQIARAGSSDGGMSALLKYLREQGQPQPTEDTTDPNLPNIEDEGSYTGNQDLREEAIKSSPVANLVLSPETFGTNMAKNLALKNIPFLLKSILNFGNRQ